MSKNASEHQRQEIVPTILRNIGRRQDEGRALQPQGSQAIRVVSVTGYHYFPVSNTSGVPEYTFIDLQLANPDEILIASLTRSTFLGYTNGTFINADNEPHGISAGHYDGWLEYDSRPNPKDEWTVAFYPEADVWSRVIDSMAQTSSPYNTVRVSLKAGRAWYDAKPTNADSYLVVYQIRATIG